MLAPAEEPGLIPGDAIFCFFVSFTCLFVCLLLLLLFSLCFLVLFFLLAYRKIPKISSGAYIFQRPFLRGLYLEGPIFGGAYVWREISVAKSIELACSGKEIFHFCLVLLHLYSRANSKYEPPGGFIFGGAI